MANVKLGGLWPQGVIPYVTPINGNVQYAIDEWKKTGLTFREKADNDYNYIKFVEGETCNSDVGFLGSGVPQQEVFCKLNDTPRRSTIIHEIGHTVGMYHEHCRIDRNSYVNLHENNIKKDCLSLKQFTKTDGVLTPNCPGNEGWGICIGKYDFESRMHYGRKSDRFAYDPSEDIFSYYPPGPQEPIDEFRSLSAGDIAGINFAYNLLALYGVDLTGNLQWHRHSFSFDQIKTVGAGWENKRLFSGGRSAIYLYDEKTGDLHWYRHKAYLTGLSDWDGPELIANEKTSEDWDFSKTIYSRPPIGRPGIILIPSEIGVKNRLRKIFSDANGIIYTFDKSGTLERRQYRGGLGENAHWTIEEIGTKWVASDIFAGSADIIYTINESGNLTRNRYLGGFDANGNAKWDSYVIGHDWGHLANKIIPAGNDVFYILEGRDLTWCQYLGAGNGWTPFTKINSGVNWANYSEIFAGLTP